MTGVSFTQHGFWVNIFSQTENSDTWYSWFISVSLRRKDRGVIQINRTEASFVLETFLISFSSWESFSNQKPGIFPVFYFRNQGDVGKSKSPK